jgi:hypothetical protein
MSAALLERTDVYILYGVRLIGVSYVTLGLIGFIPVSWINPFHGEGVGAHYLFNLVAVDAIHNVIHLAIGASGLWAAATIERSRVWSVATGIVLLLVFAAGMAQAAVEGFPADQRLLGLVTLNSPGHMLHLATGGLALYLGRAAARAARHPFAPRDGLRAT